jgi:hypothetical protein
MNQTQTLLSEQFLSGTLLSDNAKLAFITTIGLSEFYKNDSHITDDISKLIDGLKEKLTQVEVSVLDAIDEAFQYAAMTNEETFPKREPIMYYFGCCDEQGTPEDSETIPQIEHTSTDKQVDKVSQSEPEKQSTVKQVNLSVQKPNDNIDKLFDDMTKSKDESNSSKLTDEYIDNLFNIETVPKDDIPKETESQQSRWNKLFDDI